jgi:hypothetical protein
MAFQVSISITGTSVTGPFNLYECTNVTNSSCSGTALATNVSRATLTSGVSYSVSDSTKVIKISSTGTCDGTDRFLTIQNIPDTTYYYYGLGDCTNMRYSYTAVTNTGFGIIVVPGCDTASDLADLSLADPAHTSLYIDYNDPCGFGEDYAADFIGRSSVQIPEGTVYSINGQCLSVVSVDPIYTEGQYDLNLDTLAPFDGTCFDCAYVFTGFTYYNYSGTTCYGDKIIVYDILPYAFNSDPNAIRSPQIGQVYVYREYDIDGNLINPGNTCVTIDGYIGEYTGPMVTITIPGTVPPTTMSVPIGPILTGGGTIGSCGQCNPHWNLTTERCDGQFDFIGYPIWSSSTTKPVVGTVIKTNANDGVCRRITEVFDYKQIPYLGGFVGSMHTQIYYVDTLYTDCPTCTAGGAGIGQTSGNVVSITATIGQGTPLYEYCQDGNTPYNAGVFTVTFTFNGTSGPVTPDTTVEYSINGTTYTTWTPTGSTFVQDMYERYRSNCIGGVDEIDNIRIKVNDIVLLNYDLGD